MNKKTIWNTLDKLENKSVGLSYKNLQKERIRQKWSPWKPNSKIKSHSNKLKDYVN